MTRGRRLPALVDDTGTALRKMTTVHQLGRARDASGDNSQTGAIVLDSRDRIKQHSSIGMTRGLEYIASRSCFNDTSAILKPQFGQPSWKLCPDCV
ncbi:UNVERIFIED_CONTAM: hypothetical protein ABID98_001886 [Brevibacillus sp. OAP136]